MWNANTRLFRRRLPTLPTRLSDGSPLAKNPHVTHYRPDAIRKTFPSNEEFWVDLVPLLNALVLFYVLPQSAKTTFLLANSNFQFFIEATHAIKVSGTEQFKQKRAHLREITESVFYFDKETLVFGAFNHKSLLPQQRCLVSSKLRRFTEDSGQHKGRPCFAKYPLHSRRIRGS